MKIILLNHLKIQLKERCINIKLVENALLNPDQTVQEAKGLNVAHKKYFDKERNKEYLIRVIYKEKNDIRTGITVYKTSKVSKYWRQNENPL